MRAVVVVSLLLSLVSCGPVLASTEAVISAGQDLVLNPDIKKDQQDRAVSLSVQQSSKYHLGLKLFKYWSDDTAYRFASSEYYGVYAGAQKGNRFKVFGSLGTGYLNNPDGGYKSLDNNPYRGRLTDHLQFNIVLGMKYELTQKIFLSMNWDHISNCTQICNRSSKHLPNTGRDYLLTGIGFKF